MTQQAIKQLISTLFSKGLVIQGIFSNPRKKATSSITKVVLRPIEIKGETFYQISEFTKTQAHHRNVTAQEAVKQMQEQLLIAFKQAVLYTADQDYHLLTNSNLETTILSQPPSKQLGEKAHNKTKNYLFEEGIAIPFLVELGVMNAQGKVHPQKRDKFRQINRFLEMLLDVLHPFNQQKTLHIIDFGCGKAYLTFALYHFLTFNRGYDVQMVGIDLKEEVITFCQNLAKKLNYHQLHFFHGNIANFTPKATVDLVVALHACDTATDFALAKAVAWEAKVILAAPCCQHELFQQIASSSLEGLLQFGILKERFASLVTDAARAQLLEMVGYKTQVMEFIDSEHTPKNLLIRAIKGNSQKNREDATNAFFEFKKSLSITHTLEKLLLK